MTFERAVDFVLAHEGGYSDDPADTGGATKYGISRKSYPDLDIQGLTKEAAMVILRRDYWDKCRCGEMPNGLDLLVFEAAVNQGAFAAAKMLQTVLQVPQDGIVGAITLHAANNALHIKNDYLAQRMYQYALVPQVLRFGRGWYRRLADCAEIIFKEN